MGLYSDSDIKSSFEGDICLNGRGDLDIANAADTVHSSVNFIVRTDKLDYAPDVSIGANLGSFIGDKNESRTHDEMRDSVATNLGTILSPEDFDVSVVPFDLNEAIVFVYFAGTYLIDNEFVKYRKERMSFLFPYIEGNPTPLEYSAQ